MSHDLFYVEQCPNCGLTHDGQTGSVPAECVRVCEEEREKQLRAQAERLAELQAAELADAKRN